MTTWVHLTGLTPYDAAHALQERLVDARRAGGGDVVLLLEHPETITLGRRKQAIDSVLQAGTVPVVRIERGGDATYHAPGQLVAYPLVALDGPRRDVHAHLHGMERGVIALLSDLGIQAGTDPRNTGVWIDGRKVCSMGIAIRQWVSWHGLALNLDVDLAGFARIRPCGFGAEVMTRVADHTGACPAVHDLAPRLAQALAASMDLPVDRWIEATLPDAGAVDRVVAQVAAA